MQKKSSMHFKKNENGKIVACHNDKMLVLKWCDKRQVAMLFSVDTREITTVNIGSYMKIN